MVEFFSALIKALIENDMLFIGSLLASFIIGFVSGFKTHKYFFKEKHPPVRYEKLYGCIFRYDDNSRDMREVPVAFKDDKIVRIDCPFIRQGVCSKNNKKCLIYNNLT